MIEWILTGFRLISLWTTAVGFRSALQGCLWVIARKAFPKRRGLARAIMPRSRTLELRVPGSPYPLYARWPASDLHILYTIVERKEYAPIADYLNTAAEITFLDLGANIGAASRFFLDAFPTAKVVAVEPNPGNINMCHMNLDPYGPRVKLVQAAVWKENTMLAFESETTQVGTEAGVQVREVESGKNDSIKSVRAIDIPTLLSEAAVPKHSQIALKIDVEGSEEEIFNGTNLDWLDDVSCIAIELHDKFRRDCTKNFLSAVQTRLLEQPREINDTVFARLK